MNLNDIVQSAQGGQAVNNLAQKFGLSPEQAQNAINASLPAFEIGLQNMIQDGGLSALLRHFGPTHQQSYVDPTAAQSTAATQQGGGVLGSLFGGHGASADVAQQASRESGVPASVIQAMLPILASIIMGGLLHQGQSGGLGGMLAQIIRAAASGQGSSGATPGPGGLGEIFSSVLGGIFGGEAQPEATSSPGQPATGPGSGPASASSGAALDELSRAFEAGTPASPDHVASLATILGRARP